VKNEMRKSSKQSNLEFCSIGTIYGRRIKLRILLGRLVGVVEGGCGDWKHM
jgi:hypothetical protein